MSKQAFTGFTRLIALVGITLSTLSMVGCNQAAPPPAPAAKKGPSVVIVDLVAVARAVGRENTASAEMTNAGNNLNQQLDAIRKNMAQQIEDKKAEFGVDVENYTDEQKRILIAMVNEANGKMRQIRGRAQMALRQLQVQINLQFRDEVKPIAEDLAKELGADVALLTNPTSLLWYSDDSDITDEVIAEMRKRAKDQPAIPTTPPSTGTNDTGSTGTGNTGTGAPAPETTGGGDDS